MKIWEVRIGGGRIVRIWRCRGFRWIWHRHPLCGWVVGFPKSRAASRAQDFCFSLGGPLATALLAGSLLWGSALTYESRNGAALHGPLQVLSFIELGGLLMTLSPQRFVLYGMPVKTDGLLLWNALFSGREEVTSHESHRLHREAWGHVVEGRSEEAIQRMRDAARSCEARDYDKFQVLLADTLAHTGRVKESAAIYRDLLDSMKPDHPSFAHFADAFASLALFNNARDLFPEAESVLRRALQARPNASTLKGTLGGLLIERGTVDEGARLLRELHARAESETDLGIAAAYLSRLAANRGETREAARFERQARHLLPEHPLVQRVLGSGVRTSPASSSAPPPSLE
jgi:hypothetical protein